MSLHQTKLESSASYKQNCKDGVPSPNSPPFSDVVLAAEDGLLSAVIFNSSHVLRPLFPSILSRRPGLRERSHPSDLPLKDDNNYIHRILYRLLLHLPTHPLGRTSCYSIISSLNSHTFSYSYSTPCLRKNCAKFFLSELRQFFINFNNIW